MIRELDKTFILETKNTSYILYINELGLLEHVYYGRKLDFTGDYLEALRQKRPNPNGCSTVISKDAPTWALEDMCLEFSTKGKGDTKEPFAELTLADGSRTSDFRFWQSSIRSEKVSPEGLPGAYFEKEEL